jgi:hypothetical protein
MKKSEKIKLMAGDFLAGGNSKAEVQFLLDVACKAWNLALEEDIEPGLKVVLDGYRLQGSADGVLPDHLEASLRDLEVEYRKLIATKKRLFADDEDIIISSEIEGDLENFVIRVAFLKPSEVEGAVSSLLD